MRALTLFADANAAARSLQGDLTPILSAVTTVATALFALFILIGGLYYMTAATSVERKLHAKDILIKGSVGFIIVLTCSSAALFLQSAYSEKQGQPIASENLKIEKVEDSSGNFMTDTIRGFIEDVITAGTPIVDALNNFFANTPLMAQTDAVFKVWVTVLAIANILFVLVIALIGFRLMSASVFGFQEGEIRTLLPQIAGAFVVMNFSIFMIDFIISIANAMTKALVAGGDNEVLIATLKAFFGGLATVSIGGLLLILVLVVLIVLLLLYYLRRLVVLYIGAALSPLIALCWLMPVFRDFAVLATKQYIMTIFILFVHMVILLLAAVLFNSFGEESILTLLLAIATMSVLLKAGSAVNQMMGSAGIARSTKQMTVALMRGKGAMVSNYKASREPGATASSGSKFADGSSKGSTSGPPLVPTSTLGSKTATSNGKFQNSPRRSSGVTVTRVPEQTLEPKTETSKQGATPPKMKRQSAGAES